MRYSSFLASVFRAASNSAMSRGRASALAAGLSFAIRPEAQSWTLSVSCAHKSRKGGSNQSQGHRWPPFHSAAVRKRPEMRRNLLKRTS
jgi:hypothetical protein